MPELSDLANSEGHTCWAWFLTMEGGTHALPTTCLNFSDLCPAYILSTISSHGYLLPSHSERVTVETLELFYSCSVAQF